MAGKKRKWILRAILLFHGALLALVLFLALSALLVWKSPPIRGYVHAQVVRYYLRKIAPRLPFKIVDVAVEGNWPDFLKGRISNLRLVLKQNEWNVIVSGPITVNFEQHENKKHIRATYTPMIGVANRTLRIPAIPVSFSFLAEKDFAHFDELNIHTHLDHYVFSQFGADDFYFSANWDEGEANVNASAKLITFADTEISKLEFQADSPLKFEPLRIGPKGDFTISAESGKTRFGGQTFNLPLRSFPINGVLTLSNGKENLDLKVGSGSSPRILAAFEHANKTLHARWKTREISVPEFFSSLASVLHLEMPAIQKLSGKFTTEGSAEAEFPLNVKTIQETKLLGTLQAKNIAFEWPEKYLALSGLDFSLPFSIGEGVDGKISIDRILFRRAKAKLRTTSVSLKPTDGSRLHYELKIADPKGSMIPLEVQDQKLAVGNLEGSFHLPDADKKTSHYDVDSSVVLPPTTLSSLAQTFCIETPHIPPANLQIDFSKINFTSDSIEPTGKVRIGLFEGFIEATDLGMYDIHSDVPEFDFDLAMDGVRLDMLGDWTGFGEMDGVLTAHAHNVTFQSWLPTHYDFGFEVKPYSHTKVIFSPDAMRNVARLVAGQGVDNLPGIAEWFAFGWPSRFLGGYDITYAGISLFSSDGRIMLEVLDRPEPGQKQFHYILNGNRFKIPLNSKRYPLIVDATAINNYMHRMTIYFSRLAEAKKMKLKQLHEGRKDDEEKKLDCPPPTL